MYAVDVCILIDALCPDWWQQWAMWPVPVTLLDVRTNTLCFPECVQHYELCLKLVITKCLVLSADRAVHRELCFECITGCNALCIYCQSIPNVYVPKQ